MINAVNKFNETLDDSEINSVKYTTASYVKQIESTCYFIP